MFWRTMFLLMARTLVVVLTDVKLGACSAVCLIVRSFVLLI